MALANERTDLPGEFQAGPGRMAAEKGVPVDLPGPSAYQTGYTDAQRSGAIPPKPVDGAQKLQALFVTDPLDASSEPDPLALG